MTPIKVYLGLIKNFFRFRSLLSFKGSSEVELLKSLFENEIIHLALSIESGGLLVRYPLHQKVRLEARQLTSKTYDQDTFEMLSQAFHINHPKMNGPLCEGQAVGISVNGAEWEKTQGALMDYMYFKEGSLMVRDS